MCEYVTHQNNLHDYQIQFHTKLAILRKTWRMNEKAHPLFEQHHRINDEIIYVSKKNLLMLVIGQMQIM